MSVTAPQQDAPRALADALRRVDIDRRTMRQRHLGVAYTLDSEDAVWSFKMRAQRRAGQWAHVSIDDQPCGLQIRSDTSPAVGERLWLDYPSDARLMAWTLAHDAMIDSLAGLFEASVTTISLVSQPDRITDELAGPVLDVTWQARGDASAAADGAVDAQSWHGALALPDALLEQLLSRARAVPRGPEPNDWCGGIPVPVAVRCAGPTMDAQTLLACQPGDAVVLGSASRLAEHLLAVTDDDRILPVRLSARENGFLTTLTKDAPTMSQSSSTPPNAPSGARIPIQLSVQTASVEVMLSDLDGVEAGVVLPLEAPVAGTNVTILANGAAIGEGELVAAGEKLAVCITQWRADGLQ